MKKLLCFFLVILVLVSPALAADGSTLVYTTRTGECYHRYSCSSLSKSCYETTLSQAIADGYRPCGRCHPPTLDAGASSDDSSKSALDRYFEERGYGSTHSSGSSSGSSYSGYSSGSSSYSSGYSSGQSSSRASASSSRKQSGFLYDLKIFLLRIIFLPLILPPFIFITWPALFKLIKYFVRNYLIRRK